ncbi:DeoR family transcriptional regulator [Mesorhizobium sp. NBSH29]|uniref:DeoR/GlpR family DNA-binding transcription regulator n=1 Tax=Mesorhizobium sp. NBSH29 TaxID=2654249 RepID=UPI00189662E1|nr:DeoR/GlpR family DNA-binding transcription regulator [Mesorhizobium sp. NBSH29]QPC86846.1 DeoR family transcriptional regulator [Mesorhizobium sp. NBSH29]
MLTTQRKQLILETLHREGQVIAREFSQKLSLSEDTIRRDLRELAAEGKLQRVRGGALPASPTVANLTARRSMESDAKARLGRTAAGLIKPGQTVIFDGGTTNLEIIRHLPAALAFTAITHSPTIAVALEEFPAVEVLVIGGRLYRHSMVTVGALAVEQLSRIRADLFFLGITGIHPQHGLTTGNMEEAAVKRALLSRAAETVVLATSEKLGAVSPCLIAAADEIGTLVVVQHTSAASVAGLAAKGMTVLRSV